MTDYRLTREFVRREFIFGAMEYSPRITELFDRWIAEELAEAWDEGNDAGWTEANAHHENADTYPKLTIANPYRQEQA